MLNHIPGHPVVQPTGHMEPTSHSCSQVRKLNCKGLQQLSEIPQAASGQSPGSKQPAARHCGLRHDLSPSVDQDSSRLCSQCIKDKPGLLPLFPAGLAAVRIRFPPRACDVATSPGVAQHLLTTLSVTLARVIT